jgi:hypothetical protein
MMRGALAAGCHGGSDETVRGTPIGDDQRGSRPGEDAEADAEEELCLRCLCRLGLVV